MSKIVTLSAAVVASIAGVASADVFSMPAGQTSMSFVPVGNAGNVNDPATGAGAVSYGYSIGQYEVTVGQYTQFLNAVAADDTYGLYNTGMSTDARVAGISRSGSPGSYTYSAIGSPNKPAAYIGWGDAARFVNWVQNGQPIGAQGAGTTETGSYTLNGATTDAAYANISRNANAVYVLPSQNEWYKSAYFDPTKGGSNYWAYPTRSDAPVISAPPPGTSAPNASNTANFYEDDGVANGYNDGYAVTGSVFAAPNTNYLTDVGAYSSASTFYGTFDQGGNEWEWCDTQVTNANGIVRVIRGGSWQNTNHTALGSNFAAGILPSQEVNTYGFRIAMVPAPGSLALLALGGLMARRRAR